MIRDQCGFRSRSVNVVSAFFRMLRRWPEACLRMPSKLAQKLELELRDKSSVACSTQMDFFVRRRMAIEFASKVAVHAFVDVHVQAFVSWNMWLKYVAWLCGV